MGFLSAYSGTKKIPIGDPELGYWVELREIVSQGAREKAEQELMGRQQINGGDVTTQMNVVGFRKLMVLSSVVTWNLDDDNGTIWPVNVQSINRLPGIVFDELWAVVDKSNASRTAASQRQFHDTGDDGREDGEGRTGESEPVLAEAAGVEPSWDVAGTAV